MIYVITGDESRFPLNPIYRFGTKEMVINWLATVDFVPFDAETRGFDPYTKNLLSIQLGDETNQYVVDAESIGVLWLKPYLEKKIILAQNGKFDFKFLFKAGIYPRKIWDTFIAEKIITCGIDYLRSGLDAITDRYLNIKLDKSIRVDIPREGLTPRVISYAADDIKYLPAIKEAQTKKLEELDLINVLGLENEFTPCLAYIEYCGFKLDSDKWKTKMEKDQIRVLDLENRLNSWVLAGGHQRFIKQQLDIFQDQTCTVNWSSPKQMVEFFESFSIDCTVITGGAPKKSVEESVINKYRDTHEIVKIYLDFKKAEKVITTYGQNFLDQINSITGRLHTNFSQIMNTGRTSSGGKDRDKGINLVNFQNIPSDPETRSCFVAEEGNVLIVSDYAGQEQIVLANKSLDPGLLEFYDNGLADMHSFVASKMYPELEGLTLDEVKSKHKDKRQEAKAAGFAISYGGDGNTIATNLNVPKEKGIAVYNGYFAAFPGLRNYFDEAKQQGLNDGHILISPITRRKCFLPQHEKYTHLANKLDKKYWTKYRIEKAKDSEEFYDMKQDVKDYFYYKGEMERMALNYPIQGVSGEITKLATIFIYRYILDNNLFGIVKICNTIHDELVLECPKALGESIAKIVETNMNKAADYYCKRVKLTATPELTLYWKK